MSDLISNYLLDLGYLLKEKALQAKKEAYSGSAQMPDQFAAGRLAAYHEVLSLIAQQADVFGVPKAALSLEGFDPDFDLLRRDGMQ